VAEAESEQQTRICGEAFGKTLSLSSPPNISPVCISSSMADCSVGEGQKEMSGFGKIVYETIPDQGCRRWTNGTTFVQNGGRSFFDGIWDNNRRNFRIPYSGSVTTALLCAAPDLVESISRQPQDLLLFQAMKIRDV
jgi:hypothetical protein